MAGMDEERNGDFGRTDENMADEMPIDLNMLFSEDRRDLNLLFPDPRFRRFLRDVKRNQRDVKRFLKRLEGDG